MATILSALTFALCLLCGGGSLGAQKTLLASAAPQQTACTAVANGYSALSHGNELYLYSETSGIWQTYTHTQPISKLDFDDYGTLYFLDEQSSLYTLNVPDYQTGITAEDTGIICTTFTIDGNALYHVRQTWIYEAPLSDLSKEKQFYNTPSISAQTLAFWKGDLYFLYGLNYLYKLSLGTMRSTEVARLPENTTSFAIADGNFFGVTSNNTLYGYPLQNISSTMENTLVKKTDCQALSAQGNEVFFMQNQQIFSYTKVNGVQRATGAFVRPLFNKIPVGNMKADLAKDNPSFAVVETKANALLVEVDMDNATDIFPYLGATRSPSVTALELTQTEHFSVLSYQKQGEMKYSTFLVAKSEVTPKEDWETTYEEPKIGYLSNQVHILKFPRLGMASFETPLSRGEEITILGEIHFLERAYYKVQKGREIGYLPASYLTATLQENPSAERVVYGEEEADENSVFQLVFILLGCALIGILADFLILRHLKMKTTTK